MRNELFAKTFYAEGNITKHRIVKFGTTDNTAAQASDDNDNFIGVADSLSSTAGQPQDVIMSGVASVTYGGNVGRGKALTADAQGRAIEATTKGQSIVGFAMQSGVENDIGSVHIARGFYNTAA